MKKFDLEKALSGGRVITRNGKEVTGLHLFGVENNFPLFGIVDGEIRRWSKEGRIFIDVVETKFDLFMPGEKKTMWVNVYKDGDGSFITGKCLHSKEETALLNTKNPFAEFFDTVPITFEI